MLKYYESSGIIGITIFIPFQTQHDFTGAEKLFDDFFRNKPKIKQFIDDIHEKVKDEGFVETLHGFRRNLRDVYSQEGSKRNGALRQGVNTRIQGSGAYLTNTSLILIQKWLELNNMRSLVVLTVHDSVVVDAPPEEITIVAQAMKHIMENLPIEWLFIDWMPGKGRMRYPLEADIDIGINYNDVLAYDEEDFKTFKTTANYCKYYLDLQKVKNYKDVDMIDEEKYEQLTQHIESRKAVYQESD